MTAIDRDRLADWRRLHRDACGTWEVGRGRFETETNGLYIAQILDHLPALLDQIDQAEHRLDHWQEAYKREANRRAAAVTERDEWRQTAQDEHAAALDLIKVVKERDRRIEAVRNMADRMEASGRDQRPLEVVAALIRRALDGDTL